MRHEGSKPATGFVARALADALQDQYPDNLGAFRMTPITEIRRTARQAAERTGRERGLRVQIAGVPLLTKIAAIERQLDADKLAKQREQRERARERLTRTVGAAEDGFEADE